MNKAKTHTTDMNFIPWITALVLLCGLAVAGGIYWTQNVTVTSVSFKGQYFTDTQTLQKAAAVPQGVKPDSIDFEKIKASVKAISYVQDARIELEPGGDVIIRISEREPLALLADASPKMYVDADGVPLPIIEGKILNLPLVYGFGQHTSDTLRSESFVQVREFLTSAKSMPLCWVTISEVAFNPSQGVVALSQENGVKLIFGKGDFAEKLQNWESFYSQVIKFKGIENMQRIDLRFKNQIVTNET